MDFTTMKTSEGEKASRLSQSKRVAAVKDNHNQDSSNLVVSWGLKMKGVYESAAITFSKRSILFKIDVTPVDDGLERQETVKVQNMGFLPIKVQFKTNLPFRIVLKHDEEEVVEWTHEFEAHEVIDLTISFDGSHLRKDIGEMIFNSKLEVFYLGHTGSEVMTLRGEVVFPTIGLDQTLVDFGTIYNGTEAIQEFTVNNNGTFCLTYKWYIKPNSTVIQQGNFYEHVETEKVDEIPVNLQKSVEKVTAGIKEDYALLTSQHNFLKDDYKAAETINSVKPEDKHYAHGKPPSVENYESLSTGTSLEENGDSIQFLRDKIFRTRFLGMIGLEDSSVEIEDEINYLNYNQDKGKAGNTALINEIIDIIPMSGIIPAGKTQTFTVVFYGHADITFKTTAVCVIEGGTGKSIEVQGASTHASVIVMPRSFDLGTIQSNDVVTKKVTVTNIGKVSMDVKLSLSSGKQSEIMHCVGLLEIVPTFATVQAGRSANFKVSYSPEILGTFHSAFFVKAQYCGTIKIEIRGEYIEKPQQKFSESAIQPQSPSMIPILKTGSSELLLNEKTRKSNVQEGLQEEDETIPKVKRKCKHKKNKIKTEIPLVPKPEKVKRKKSHKKRYRELKDVNCIEVGDMNNQTDGKKYCELPAISNSPEVIFSKIIETVGEDELVDRVYIRDQDCFEFGPTLVAIRHDNVKKTSTSPNSSIPDGRIQTYKTKHEENVSTFTVKNVSHIPAVCTVCLLHGRHKYFEFNPANFTVQPGEEQKVTLWAFPKVPYDLLEDHLVFCIKDNPDSMFFRIRVMGAQPKITMEEDVIDFGRCLLNSRSVSQISVTNAGLIPIVWEISSETPLPEQVYAEKTSGTLKPKEMAELRFLFKASRPTVINEHTMDIVFKDTQDILGIIDVFKIALYGEAYDVLVDIAAEKENFTLIDFGNMPVGHPIIENLVVTNRGKYEIMFKFIIEPSNLRPKQKGKMSKHLKDCFLIQPMEDVLGPSEACIVQVVFEAPLELDFVNENFLKCQIIDRNMNVIVTELPIPVTVKAEHASGDGGDDRKKWRV